MAMLIGADAGPALILCGGWKFKNVVVDVILVDAGLIRPIFIRSAAGSGLAVNPKADTKVIQSHRTAVVKSLLLLTLHFGRPLP